MFAYRSSRLRRFHQCSPRQLPCFEIFIQDLAKFNIQMVTNFNFIRSSSGHSCWTCSAVLCNQALSSSSSSIQAPRAATLKAGTTERRSTEWRKIIPNSKTQNGGKPPQVNYNPTLTLTRSVF